MSPENGKGENVIDLMIIGAGAAGMTAGIYGARSGLRTVVFEGRGAGGQTGVASTIENYPGFPTIAGIELAMKFKEHALEYAEILEGKNIEKIIPIKERDDVHFRAIDSDGCEYLVGAVILCTGARHRKLAVTGEKEFDGKGVSYCATCDGFFFRNKKVFMIGGGNTALMEGIYLHETGVDVTIVHRRDEFRGEKVYREKIKELGIPVIWDSILEEIRGDSLVGSIVLKNVMTDEMSEHKADGVFVAIGVIPNNKLAKELGCELEENGFVKVDRKQRTNIPYIYAAGDVTGGLQQIVVAGGEGAVSSMTAYKDLSHPYWA